MKFMDDDYAKLAEILLEEDRLTPQQITAELDMPEGRARELLVQAIKRRYIELMQTGYIQLTEVLGYACLMNYRGGHKFAPKNRRK